MSALKKKQEFYQHHLNLVSRSFAFCIAELEYPMREWVGLSYILCRIADTVEDALWTDRKAQLEAFDTLTKFVEGRELPADLTDDVLPNEARFQSVYKSTYESTYQSSYDQWHKSIPSSIKASEAELLADGMQFLSDLHALPEGPREAIQKTVLNMIRGMKHFCEHTSPGKHIQVANLPAANQYCFFVAGIVGELLTELMVLATPNFKYKHSLLVDSVHFGLYLQKINLLKDQRGDEVEGRFLVNSREEFKADLVKNAKRSLEYLLQIPSERADYRLFCAWSLYIGLASLPWIEKSWNEKSDAKIPRTETALVMAKVKLSIRNNEALKKYFNTLLAKAPKPAPVTAPVVKTSAKNTKANSAAAKSTRSKTSKNGATTAATEKTPGKTSVKTSQKATPKTPSWLSEIYTGQILNKDLIQLGLGQ